MNQVVFKSTAGNQTKELLLVFNGWGMDEQVFSGLIPTHLDTIVVSDYTTLKKDKLVNKLDDYDTIYLLAWSMGVLQAQQFFVDQVDLLKKVDFALAVNGTLNPIDEVCGIPPQMFEEMAESFTDAVRSTFYRKMCGLSLERFLQNEPKRPIDSQEKELKHLLKVVVPIKLEDSIFNRVLVSTKDFVMPTKSQQHFWKGNNVVTVKAPHFPFYNWTDLLECLNFCRKGR